MEDEERPVRVLIVDDEAIIRAGLEMLLDATAGVDVVGQASHGREAIELAGTLRPDLVLMDLRMPVLDGVKATAEIVQRWAETKVVALTTFDDEALMYDALRAGASGYLLKHAAPSQLAEAIRRVHGGASWIDPDMAGKVISALRRRVQTTDDPSVITDVLTPREQEVLKLVAQGMSNQEIRDLLVLSEATVKTHVARILMKTGSRDRASAVSLAWRTGFVDGAPRGASSGT